jgi:segregation and condensation protein B
MSAEERPPAEDVEEPAAVPTVDELSAAKEKSQVEDSEGDLPPDDLDGDDDDNDDDDDENAAQSEDGNDENDAAKAEKDEEEAEMDVAASAPEVTDGSDASGNGEQNREIEEVAAETVETPSAIAAPPQPQVTDVVSSDHVQNLRLLEALLFAGTQALDEKELTDRLPNDADLPHLLADLAELYANRGINLVKVAGGYAFRTAPDLSEKLKIERPVTRKLSRASVETLAIIAYHQPVTRAEIEQVRGVGLSKGTLDLLFEQNWIKPMGRRRAPGKPVTWGTTDFFLEHFGLSSLDDLPGHEEMRAAGLLDPRAQPPIFRPEEPDLPLEPTEDEAVEPLAVEEQGTGRATGPQ